MNTREYLEKVDNSANDFVEVKGSWIGEFSGLFARKALSEGQVICIYHGKLLRTSDAIKLDDKSYLMRLGEQVYVDAREKLDCLARFINDCRNPAGYNVRFEKHPSAGVALIVATRDVKAGEELFVDYGKWYWLRQYPTRLSFSELQRHYSSLQHSID